MEIETDACSNNRAENRSIYIYIENVYATTDPYDGGTCSRCYVLSWKVKDRPVSHFFLSGEDHVRLARLCLPHAYAVHPPTHSFPEAAQQSPHGNTQPQLSGHLSFPSTLPQLSSHRSWLQCCEFLSGRAQLGSYKSQATCMKRNGR